MALTPERPMRRIAFKVGRKGSTVSAVARQYGVSPSLVAEWNRVGAQAAFKAGQSVVVYVPARATAPKVRSVSPKARAGSTSRAAAAASKRSTRSASAARPTHR
jgi:membrane-bound lytic murein transglycosylase D